MKLLLALLTTSIALTLVGCDSPQKTTETLRTQIADFKANPSAEKQQAIENNFTKLDTQIAKVRADGDTTLADSLQSDAQNLRADYQAAKLLTVIDGARKSIQDVGSSFKDAGETIGTALKEAFQSPTPTSPERDQN